MSRTVRQFRSAAAALMLVFAAGAAAAAPASAAPDRAASESLVEASVRWLQVDPVAKGVNPHGNTHRVGGSYRSVNGQQLAYFQSQNQDCAPGETWWEFFPTTPGPYCTPMALSSGFGSDITFTYDKRLGTAHLVGVFPIATGFDGIPLPTPVDLTWTASGDLMSDATATRQDGPDGPVLVRQSVDRRMMTLSGKVNGVNIPTPADGTLARSETVVLPLGRPAQG